MIEILKGIKAGKLPSGIRHSLWSLADAGLYPVVYLSTVPILYRKLGSEQFGLWIVLNSLMIILQLFNFNAGVANLGMAIVRNLSIARTRNDDRALNDTLNGSIIITFFLVCLVIISGFILSRAAVAFSLWGLNDIKDAHISSCILIASVIAGMKYFDQVFQTIIKAYERFKMSSILNMISRFGLLAINLVLALAGFSILQMLIANSVFIFLYLILQYILVKKLIPSFRLSPVNDKIIYKDLLHFSFFPWMQALFIVIAFQTDRFWVSSYAGLTEVSAYGLASTMFNHIHMIFTAMAIWVLPRISLMTTKGEETTIFYNKVRRFLLGFVFISLMLFFFIAPILVPLWMGPMPSTQLYNYIKTFIAFELIFAHSILPIFYLNASGHERLATKLTLFYCGLSYVFMIGALYLFKSPLLMILGMTISFCISMPLINIYVSIKQGLSYSLNHWLKEIVPVYAAIFLIYWTGNNWIFAGILIIVFILSAKFYFGGVFNKQIWRNLISQ